MGPEQVIGTQQLTVAANEYLPIYVSNVVTPGHFWFQIDGEQYGRLVDLMEMLQYVELLIIFNHLFQYFI